VETSPGLASLKPPAGRSPSPDYPAQSATSRSAGCGSTGRWKASSCSACKTTARSATSVSTVCSNRGDARATRSRVPARGQPEARPRWHTAGALSPAPPRRSRNLLVGPGLAAVHGGGVAEARRAADRDDVRPAITWLVRLRFVDGTDGWLGYQSALVRPRADGKS